MYFLESIRAHKHLFENLALHQARVNSVFAAYFPLLPVIDLFSLQIPANLGEGLYKCRIIYAEKIEQLEFVPYQIKPIRSLRLVEGNHIAYCHKFAEREALLALYQQRNAADDVLILKNGLLTDTSYGNIAFWNGEQWLTPEFPLLEGTQRAKLIHLKVIFPQEISPKDFPRFQRFKIFNALRVWEEVEEVSIENIF